MADKPDKTPCSPNNLCAGQNSCTNFGLAITLTHCSKGICVYFGKQFIDEFSIFLNKIEAIISANKSSLSEPFSYTSCLKACIACLKLWASMLKPKKLRVA